ncbi:flagellar basal body rod protein FlgC [Mycobacteroides abscessus subsp. abscessus]|nr:flagellar basal body rod protein FlgC [Mycobacteroides abscessus subsp. abscessus]
MSNVNMADEMVDMMNTIRTYEANVTATNASKSMLSKALEISAR